MKKFAPELLIYLYYALDNRPWYFRAILRVVTWIRLCLSRVKSPLLRKAFSVLGVYTVYLPLISLGRVLKPFHLAHSVPLYDVYHDKNLRQIEQDVYDRFFTRIEQRVSRTQIQTLKDTFSDVRLSDQLPYWHFVCRN